MTRYTPNTNKKSSRHSSFKDLGVFYSNTLYIAYITVIARTRCNYIYRAFFTDDLRILGRLFAVYVRPVIEYGSVIWNPIEVQPGLGFFDFTIYRFFGVSQKKYFSTIR